MNIISLDSNLRILIKQKLANKTTLQQLQAEVTEKRPNALLL